MKAIQMECPNHQVVNGAYASWLDLSVEWMKKVYGKPELIDKSTSKMAKFMAELGFGVQDTKGGEFA